MSERASKHTAAAGTTWLLGVIGALGLVCPGPRPTVHQAELAEPVEVDATSVEATSADPSSSTTPSRLVGDEADTLVRVLGGGVCSGTPIAGTNYVVTAAHCVLDHDGRPGRRTVVRGDDRTDAVAVVVDVTYHDHPSPLLDAAVLVLDHPFPGPRARLGDDVPTAGTLTLAGYQPLDDDGTLLRGTNPHDRPRPTNESATLIEIGSAPAGCVVDATELDVSPARVRVPCALIPGASGGGLFTQSADGVSLVGIVSTVSFDLTSNGVVPLASVKGLLAHPAIHTHDLTVIAGQVSPARIIRT